MTTTEMAWVAGSDDEENLYHLFYHWLLDGLLDVLPADFFHWSRQSEALGESSRE
jgi:hypothetical protein